jgi:hypothetical protein
MLKKASACDGFGPRREGKLELDKLAIRLAL